LLVGVVSVPTPSPVEPVERVERAVRLFRRVEVMPGVELTIAEDAPATSKTFVERVLREASQHEGKPSHDDEDRET
jgi:hypothetical protein